MTVTAATNTLASDATNTSSKNATQQMGEAQDRFLKLLVAQMQNQDPLNPLDNAQVTSQMAQISTVSGIEKLNVAMEKMSEMFSSNQSLQTAGLVGKHVLVPGTSLELVDEASVGGVDLKGDADSVVVEIRNEGGELIATQNLGPRDAGVLAFNWDGALDKAEGAKAENGTYYVTVKAERGGEKVEAQALSLGQVYSVTLTATGAKLNVTGQADPMELSQVRMVL